MATAATVAEQYRTPTSHGGQERDLDGLSAKEALNYQDGPNDGDQCSDCTYHISNKNGDGSGACTLLEGTNDPEGWWSSLTPSTGGDPGSPEKGQLTGWTHWRPSR